MKKRWLIISLISALAIMLLTISFKNIVSLPKAVNIIIVGKTSDPSIEFWSVMKEGFNAAAKEFNVRYEYIAPETEWNIDNQVEILRDAINKKPDGIILISADYNKLKEETQKAIKSNIKLITLDSSVEVDGVTLVATDNFTAGVKAGQELYKITKSDKDVAIVSYMKNSSSALNRELGFRKGFGYGQDSRISSVLYCESSRQKAFELVCDMLKTNPKIGAIVGLNEFSTCGAADAIKYLNMQSKVKLVGFDNSSYEIKCLEDGTISAIVIQQPFNMGYLAIKSLYEMINNKALDTNIYTDSVLITPENMYNPTNQKLLFPLSL